MEQIASIHGVDRTNFKFEIKIFQREEFPCLLKIVTYINAVQINAIEMILIEPLDVESLTGIIHEKGKPALPFNVGPGLEYKVDKSTLTEEEIKAIENNPMTVPLRSMIANLTIDEFIKRSPQMGTRLFNVFRSKMYIREEEVYREVRDKWKKVSDINHREFKEINGGGPKLWKELEQLLKNMNYIVS
jgi:hypothetical protein